MILIAPFTGDMIGGHTQSAKNRSDLLNKMERKYSIYFVIHHYAFFFVMIQSYACTAKAIEDDRFVFSRRFVQDINGAT